MAPKLVTAPRLAGILNELQSREPIFHRREFGASRRDFENMTDPDFWEVGASGRRYSREFILDTLDNRLPRGEVDEWQANGFHCTEVAADNYLITYTLHQGPRVTRRATLWRHSKAGWQALYHQGTVVDAAP
jgi:hypothetical protein